MFISKLETIFENVYQFITETEFQKMIKKLKNNQIKSAETKWSEKELKSFYKMLLKFKKHHPAFDAKRLFEKLYPNSGISFKE